MDDVSPTLFESLLELFAVYTMGKGRGKANQRLTAQEFRGESVSGDAPVGRVHGGSDQHVTQFADVARPGILTEALKDLQRDFGCRESFFIKQMTDKPR